MHLARFELALAHVAGLHHGQTQVLRIQGATEIRGDIGHVLVGQGAAKGQRQADASSCGLCAIDRHRDVARTEQGVERRLRIGLQSAGVAAVGNGGAVVAGAAVVDVRDLEVALGQLLIQRQRHQTQAVQANACEVAGKLHVVTVFCARHGDRAQAAQGGVVAGLGQAQSRLHSAHRAAQGQVSAGVGFAVVAQAQTVAAIGAVLAVDDYLLDLGLGGSAVAHQAVVQVGAGNADAFAGEVLVTQSTNKGDGVFFAAFVTGVQLNIHRRGVGHIARQAFEQGGVGRFEVGDVGGGVAHHKGAAGGAAHGRRALGLQLEQAQVLALQAAPGRDQHLAGGGAGTLHRELGARNACTGAVERCLNFCRSGMPRDERGLVSGACVAQGQGEALVEGIAAQDHALHLRDRSHARGGHLGGGAGMGEAAVINTDVSHIGLRQGAHKPDVQAHQAGVGLGGIEANLDVGGAHIGERGQGGLHALGQQCAVGGVRDVGGGLAVKTQVECACGGQGRRGAVDGQHRQVFAFERAPKGDQVVGAGAAADVDGATGARQRRVQGIAHGGRVGAELNAGGGVGLAVVAQAEREAATAPAQADLLDFRLAHTAALERGVAVAGGGGIGAAQVEVKAGVRHRPARQGTDEGDHVAVTRAAVAGVAGDGDGRGVDHAASQIFEQGGVGRAHLAEGLRHVVAVAVDSTHLGGGVRQTEDLVFLDDFVGLEHHGQGSRLTHRARLQFADLAGDGGRGGRGVADQVKALHFAGPHHCGGLLLHQAVVDQVHGVAARHTR